MNDSILLIGGGGHCKACIDVLEQEGRFKIFGIIDQPERVGASVLGYRIIATDAHLSEYTNKHHCLITIGHIRSVDVRLRIFHTLQELHARMATVISPEAYVSPHADIGEGVIIMHRATVNAGARVGDNCIINSHALIEHDAVIGDHCHIATGAIINGGVAIGAQTFIGSRAMTREYITIGDQSFIAGGMNIYADLPEKSEVKPR